MYQLMLADIKMLMIIQMYRKRHILRTVLIFFNIDFQRSRSGFTFDEKNQNIFFTLNIFQKNVTRMVLKQFITITIRIML